MKFNADIYVKDVPGQLVASLEPISLHEGNIIGVFHDREQVLSGRILVHVIFDMPQTSLAGLKKEWKDRDVNIVKVDEAPEDLLVDYLLIGDIHSKRLEKSVSEFMDKMPFGSIQARYISKNPAKTGSMLFSLTVSGEEDVKKLDDFFDKKAKQEKLTIIKGVVS